MGVGGEPAGGGEELDGVGRLDVEELPTPSDASRWMQSMTKHCVVKVEGSGGDRRVRREIQSFLYPFCRHRAGSIPIRREHRASPGDGKRGREGSDFSLNERPPPLPSTLMTQCFVIDYIYLEASGGVGSSSIASLPTPASESPSTPPSSSPPLTGSPPTPTTTSV